MPVDTLHPLYVEYQPKWKFSRDAIDGDDSIKAGGTTYVPKLSGQDEDQYKAYLNRAMFEGYTQRVLDGLTGLIFSKAPTVIAPKQLEDLFTNIDLQGSTLTDYAQDLANEVESVGRVGGLIDMGVSEGKNRPYATIYKTENIINWRYQNIGNENVLSLVVLQELEDDWIDIFTNEPKTIYRVLQLTTNEDTQPLHYEQHIYRPNIDNVTKKVNGFNIEVIVPLRKGKMLERIPFVGITPEKLTLNPEKPPLYDVCKVNVAHFKLNVDYYHGMHFTALPTPYGAGIQAQEIENANFKIGSTSFTWFTQPQAKLSYLEFEGKGLETLENEKAKLVEAMVVLGSNMLQGDKKTAEAENTVAMRSAGQNASLISTADTISRGITKLLEIMAEWMGASGKVSYDLNTDFNLTQISPQLLKEIIAGNTLGKIPLQVVYDSLKDGELLSESIKDFEAFKTALEEEAPVINSALPPKPSNNKDDEDIKKIAEAIGA